MWCLKFLDFLWAHQQIWIVPIDVEYVIFNFVTVLAYVIQAWDKKLARLRLQVTINERVNPLRKSQAETIASLKLHSPSYCSFAPLYGSFCHGAI